MSIVIYAQGSCDETKYWLELARDLGLIEKHKSEALLAGYQELTHCLVAMIQRVSQESQSLIISGLHVLEKGIS